jgi:hypothetical protein
MIQVQLYSNEIGQGGELLEHLAASFTVSGQEIKVTGGNPRYIQLGIPVYSRRYGGLIDFDRDGEEWARNLAAAYRNGAVSAVAQEVAAVRNPPKSVLDRIPALAANFRRHR